MSREFTCPECADVLVTPKGLHWHFRHRHAHSMEEAYEAVALCLGESFGDGEKFDVRFSEFREIDERIEQERELVGFRHDDGTAYSLHYFRDDGQVKRSVLRPQAVRAIELRDHLAALPRDERATRWQEVAYLRDWSLANRDVVEFEMAARGRAPKWAQ